jgi:hypothetical protein
MTDIDPPWRPPVAGTETEHLIGALDGLRAPFRWKADELGLGGAPDSRRRHVADPRWHAQARRCVEDYSFTVNLRGEPFGAPWDGFGWGGSTDWDFTSAAEDTPVQLSALWDGGVAGSRERLGAALGDSGVDQIVHFSGPKGQPASPRRLVCDLVEEYGRHTGHADLLREAVDGRVGEDSPADWRP